MDAPCPHCNKTLFRIRPVDEDAPDVPAISTDDPHIQHDGDIDYVICPNCNERVLMDRVAGGPSGLQFKISRNQ